MSVAARAAVARLFGEDARLNLKRADVRRRGMMGCWGPESTPGTAKGVRDEVGRVRGWEAE